VGKRQAFVVSVAFAAVAVLGLGWKCRSKFVPKQILHSDEPVA